MLAPDSQLINAIEMLLSLCSTEGSSLIYFFTRFKSPISLYRDVEWIHRDVLGDAFSHCYMETALIQAEVSAHKGMNSHAMARTTTQDISYQSSPPEKQVIHRNRQGSHSQDDGLERVEDLPSLFLELASCLNSRG